MPFRIDDHRLVWVVIDIAERDLNQVSVGAKVTIRPRGLDGQTFTGTVALIYPHLNAQTRIARIRVVLPNPDEVLRPEMYVDAEIETGTPAPVLAAPESAVLDDGAHQAVLVDKETDVSNRARSSSASASAATLKFPTESPKGKPVVTSANFLIDAKSNLKAALQGLAGADAPQPAATSSDAKDIGGHR